MSEEKVTAESTRDPELEIPIRFRLNGKVETELTKLLDTEYPASKIVSMVLAEFLSYKQVNPEECSLSYFNDTHEYRIDNDSTLKKYEDCLAGDHSGLYIDYPKCTEKEIRREQKDLGLRRT